MADLSEDVTSEILDLNDYEVPLYSADREEADGIPGLVQDFFAKIGAADGLIISFAEHNGVYTAAYKNVFDWASRIDVKLYQGKPSVFLATSPGGRGGQGVLGLAESRASSFGADLRGTLSVPSFYENFDSAQGVLRDSELSGKLSAVLSALGA